MESSRGSAGPGSGVNAGVTALIEPELLHQLWLLSLEGGEAQPITWMDGDVAHFRWSAAAQRIAFVLTDRPPAQERERIERKQDAIEVDAHPRSQHVPVVDLDILGVFLSGQHVSWQIWHRNAVTREGLINLYGSPQEAALNLEEFMNDPPQLRRVKASIVTRTVSSELINCGYRQIIVATYRVNIDFDAELSDAPRNRFHEEDICLCRVQLSFSN